jgi:pimeloyl-ACP methyl ester carboxylesterase
VPSALTNGISIEYETLGDPASPRVLLVNGFTLQLTMWDPRFLQALAGRGYYVVYFDNRDVGLSTWCDEGSGDGAESGSSGAPAQYSIGDMAEDAIGLMDALGISSAHVVGYSMGGMIAQTMAIEHPERVLTLTSISSTTGDPGVGRPHPQALEVITAPTSGTREEAVDKMVETWRVIGSPGYPFDEAAVRARAERDHDRANNPRGAERQFVAIVTQPDRTESLGELRVPTLVVHGDADTLIDPSGGIATSEAIPGARLVLIADLGHDLHPDVIDDLVDELARHFELG